LKNAEYLSKELGKISYLIPPRIDLGVRTFFIWKRSKFKKEIAGIDVIRSSTQLKQKYHPAYYAKILRLLEQDTLNLVFAAVVSGKSFILFF